MQRILRFLKNVVYSFSSAEFYNKVLVAPFSFSVKYFLFLILLAGIIYSIFYNITISPVLNKISNNAPYFIEKIVPNDFMLIIKDGKADYSGKEPVIISVNDFLKNIGLEDAKNFLGYNNLLVIDTKTQFSLEMYHKYDSFVWLNSDSMVSPDPDNPASDVKITSHGHIDSSITKNNILEFSRWLLQIQKKVLIGFAFASLPVSIIYLILKNSLMLFWVALIAFIIGKFAKYNYCFKKYFQLSVHASTLPFLIEAGLNISLLYNFIPARIPFWYPLLTLIILFFFLRKSEVKEVKI